VVVAVVSMRMVQPSVYQVIDVVGVRHRFVSATWPMLMRAARLRGAVHRICRAHGQRVLVNMIAMNMVEMTVVQIIDMAIMANRRMPAVGAMLVSMVRMVLLVARGHGVCSFHYFSCASMFHHSKH
jgi:hypothetical protein